MNSLQEPHCLTPNVISAILDTEVIALNFCTFYLTPYPLNETGTDE